VSVAILAGQCGFAGCDQTVLLTVAFESTGSNTKTDVVAAVVKLNTYTQLAQVEKTLERAELEEISRK
jgi:hypothetical protein